MFVALDIRHVMRMRCIAICGLVCVYHVFPYYLTNGTISGRKKRFNTMSVLIYCTTLFETLLILRRIDRDVFVNNLKYQLDATR